MRKSQGIILVPVKGTVVNHATPAHGSYPLGLQENTSLSAQFSAVVLLPSQAPLLPRPGVDPTLVDELVECMLAIGPWLSPYNGARLVVHTDAGLGDVLPIGLHVTLECRHRSFMHCAPSPAWVAPAP